jgi:IS5 family transposase
VEKLQKIRQKHSKSCKIKPMSKPSRIDSKQGELFRQRLSEQLDLEHPLIQLSAIIEWENLEKDLEKHHCEEAGQPPKPIRLMVGLMMLQHMKGLSDEEVVDQWIENPYWQYFCGYDYLQCRKPIHPTSLTHWRQRLGPEGMEKILAATVKAAQVSGKMKKESPQKVIADTTVMEKAITHPTDSKLALKATEKLVKLRRSKA